MKASLCRFAVGVALGVLTPWAPAFAQTASQPADPMAKSVESARDAKNRWLDTAKATSPFQPKGDQRWPPDPTPAPDAFQATGQTYAAGNSYTPRGIYTRDDYTPRNSYSPIDTPYRVSDQNATVSWNYNGYSNRTPSMALPSYPSTVTRAVPVPSYYRPVQVAVPVYRPALFVPVVAGPRYVSYPGYVSYPAYVSYRAYVSYPTDVSYPTYASYPTFNSWPIGSFGGPRRAARSVYVVSQCYAGDEPPKDYQLPAGCTGPATPAR